jgi:pyruvate formate lyase activating enzyme
MTTLLQQLATYAPPEHRANGALVCNLCAHRCVLKPGRVGLCGAIENRDGLLHCRVYGQPVVLHADPVERKPLYHVFPGTRVLSLATAGCNMTCTFCQNWRISQARPELTAQESTCPPEAVVAAALEQGCDGIAFTYNEPTIYLDYAADIMRLAKQAGLYTLFKSNGYLTPEAIDALDGLLDAVNVDLKGFDEVYYRQVCGARLQPVCEAIAHLQRRGVWLEVATLLIPGINDSEDELIALTSFLAHISRDIPWHVWRFHPDYRMLDRPWTHIDDLDRAISIGRVAGLRYVYASNTPGDPNQHTRCPGCDAVLLSRQGNTTTANHLAGGRCQECGWMLPGLFKT